MKKVELDDQSLRNVISAQRDLHELLPEVDKLEECGVECSDLRYQIKENLARSQAIIRNYGRDLPVS